MTLCKIEYSDGEIEYLADHDWSRTLRSLSSEHGFTFTVEPLMNVRSQKEAEHYLAQYREEGGQLKVRPSVKLATAVNTPNYKAMLEGLYKTIDTVRAELDHLKRSME